MSEVKRWNAWGGDVSESEKGTYVLYADHAAKVAELEKKLEGPHILAGETWYSEGMHKEILGDAQETIRQLTSTVTELKKGRKTLDKRISQYRGYLHSIGVAITGGKVSPRDVYHFVCEIVGGLGQQVDMQNLSRNDAIEAARLEEREACAEALVEVGYLIDPRVEDWIEEKKKAAVVESFVRIAQGAIRTRTQAPTDGGGGEGEKCPLCGELESDHIERWVHGPCSVTGKEPRLNNCSPELRDPDRRDPTNET